VIASVSRRYAKALLSLALEGGEHERIEEQIAGVAKTISDSQEARTLVHSPGYSAAHRHALVDVLAERLQLSASLVSFLHLLVERNRLPELPDIARSYRELVDAQVGRVRGTVTSAQPLAEDELERLRGALAQVTRKSLVLDTRTDGRILGGVVAEVGTTVWDGSLKTQLERLRQELKQRPF
jgi:F-type H+-transporting ATPase subunit delta